MGRFSDSSISFQKLLMMMMPTRLSSVRCFWGDISNDVVPDEKLLKFSETDDDNDEFKMKYILHVDILLGSESSPVSSILQLLI